MENICAWHHIKPRPLWIVIEHTCGNNMEDTGISLLAYRVPAPAHESAIFQCTRRREGQKAGGAVGAYKSTAHCLSLGGIVKSPSVVQREASK